jgi:hypothetical protein
VQNPGDPFTSGDFFPVGVNTITYIATDASSNTNTCSFTITIVDNQLPVITCPATANINTDLGLCTSSASIGTATFTDNCAGGSVAVLPAGPYAIGATNVVWTATDANGNTSSCTQVVNVTDTLAPVITCPATANINTDFGLCTSSASIGTATFTDNCAGGSVAVLPAGPYAIGSTNVVWTATDATGNTSSCSANIIVNDATAPTAACANFTANLDFTGNVTIVAANIDNGSADNCGVPSLSLDITSFDCSDIGSPVTVTLTASDAAGNTSTCAALVTVNDVTAPVADVVNIDVTSQCAVTVTAPTATDNCAGSLTGTTLDPLTYSTQGTFTVTWTFNDGNGNTSTQVQTVTVDDITAPAADAASLTTVTGECNATILAAPTATDNCVGAVTGTTTDPLTYNTQGTFTVTWTYNDGNGNTSTQVQTVTVDDITAPAADAASLTTVTGECNATILTAPTATDNCVGAVTGTTTDPLTYNTQGTFTVTWTYNDGNGNTSTQVQVVTVDDVTAPVADVANIDVTGECSVTVTAPTATDNCIGPVTGTTLDPLTYSTQGTFNVTWTYNDGNGNTSTQVQTVTINDVTAPTALCQAITVYLDATGNATITGSDVDGGSSDNCSIVILSVVANSFTCANLGSNNVTLTVTDIGGNTATCSGIIDVVDTIDPVITCPIDISVNNDPGLCSAGIAALTPATAADNCSILSISNDAPVVFNVGNTIVTWLATDIDGNTSTCTQNVLVIDTEAPNAICQNITVYLDATGNVSVNPSSVDNGSADNCGITSMVLTPSSFNCSNIGVNNVTLTVFDVAGNSDFCAATITILDTLDPSAICQNITGYLDATGNVSVNPSSVDNGSSDNCGITSMVLTPSTFNCSNIGVNNVTLTVFDVSGNNDFCTATITILDTLSPTVLPPANVVVNADLGSCFAATVAIGNPTITENCGVATIINDGLGIYPVGVTAVTWTVIDFSGNSTSVTQTVTVIDNQLPIVACQNISVNLDATGNAIINSTQIDNGSTDNCGIDTMVLSQTNFNCSDVGANNIILTVTDVNGNVSTCSAVVTVIDNTAPAVTAPSNVTVNANLASCFATGVSLGLPVSSDNCGIASVTNDAPTSFPVGTTTVTWIVTDNNGNTSSVTQTVTVIDNQAPVFVFTPSNMVMSNIFNSCFATATWSAPIITDNCSITSVTSNFASGSVFTVGTTTVVYTATDASGNTTTSSFTVTVNDTQSPLIIGMPSDIIVNATLGACSAVATWTMPTAFDNCSGVTLTSTFAPGSTFPVGTTTVVITATDAAGNISTSSFDVIVIDNQAPVATVISPITIPALTGVCFLPTFLLDPPTTSDNCGIASVISNASAPIPVGTHVITWTVTDLNGNTTTVSQTVIIVDDQTPVIIPPANVNATVNAANCSATGVSLGIPVFSDNCGIASVSNNALVSYPSGVTQVTWTAVDIHGNVSTAIQNVTVTSTPIVISIATSPNDTVCANTSVTLTASGATSYAWTGGIFNNVPFTAGATATYTVTATGAFGCTATAAAAVTVNPLPVVSYTVSPNDTVCANSTVTLSGTGASSYVWSGGVVLDAVPFNISTTSTFTVTGTDVLGCSNTATAAVYVHDAQLIYTAFPNDTVCEGTTITLNGAGGSGYTWTSGINDGVPFTPLFSSATVLSGVDSFGCAASIFVDIVVNPNPVVNLGADIITSSSFVALDAGNTGSDYLWNGNGLLTTQSVFVNNNGTYYVEVTDNFGCIGTDTINVAFSFAGLDTEDEIELNLYPNPNNGIFTLSLSQMPEGDTEIRLVNEIGQVVFASQLQSQTQTFDFSYLRAATYYFQIINTGKTITKTFIITNKY